MTLPALKNDRLIRALLRQPTDTTPVWIMRQAGRYLPEYRETRQQAGSFLDLCKNTELACEVTLQPLRRFALDAAILFSDILTIPDAMGLGLYFAEGEGPKFERPLRSADAIRRLGVPDPPVALAIGPQWRGGGGDALAVHSPIDGSQLAAFNAATPQEIGEAVGEVAAAFRQWRTVAGGGQVEGRVRQRPVRQHIGVVIDQKPVHPGVHEQIRQKPREVADRNTE